MKWRLAYVEGGEYKDYVPVLQETMRYLSEMGWFEKPACLEPAETSREVWDCLAQVQSPHVAFVEDAFWSSKWQSELRQANRKAYLQRFKERGDIDLVIAMGTWAGQDLANDEHSVPTVVMSTSNALQAGIIESAADSGRDHVHARVDPLRYARQVRLFHSVIDFDRLGIVFEDTPEGRSYSAMNMVEMVASEQGFEVVTCEVKLSEQDIETTNAQVLACYKELAPKVDAMYITINRAVTPHTLPALLQPLYEHNVPGFAMGTIYEVKQGALMSMAQSNFDHLNRFWAQTIAKILNGATPRLLTQVKEDPHKIAINLEAAELLGIDLPLGILGGAEVIYEHIVDPPQEQP